MAERDRVNIWVRVRGAKQGGREVRGLSRDIDDLGDEAAQAARKLGRLSAASTSARINIGPLSTTARGGALAVGALTLATGRLTPGLIAAGEAAAHLAGGAGAGGAGMLLALAQGAGVAKLGLGGLGDALGGSEEAAKGLTPEVRDLFDVLVEDRDKLREIARDGLIPGLTEGAKSARRNLPVLNAIVGDTSSVLGDLARDAGDMAGSKAWGRDLGRVGKANARILDDLGHSGLNLADAARHILVEAMPLAEWMADSIRDGTALAETWALNARTSGDMADFFREARRDLELLASAGGHGTRGIINLFGSQDVDGTKMLQNLDRISARFEEWTNSPAVRESLGDAIVEEIPQAVAAGMDAIARNLPATAGTAAKVFWESFWDASLGGKGLMAAALFAKFGGFGALGSGIGKGLGVGGGLGKGAPIPVYVTNWGGGPPVPDPKNKTRNPLLGPAAVVATAEIIRQKDIAAREAGLQRPSTRTPLVPSQDPRVEGGATANLAFKIGEALGLPGFDRKPQGPSTSRIDPFGMPGPFQPIIESTTVVNVGGRRVQKTVTRERARVRAREGRQ